MPIVSADEVWSARRLRLAERRERETEAGNRVWSEIDLLSPRAVEGR
jgi:hypothetical protein